MNDGLKEFQELARRLGELGSAPLVVKADVAAEAGAERVYGFGPTQQALRYTRP